MDEYAYDMQNHLNEGSALYEAVDKRLSGLFLRAKYLSSKIADTYAEIEALRRIESDPIVTLHSIQRSNFMQYQMQSSSSSSVTLRIPPSSLYTALTDKDAMIAKRSCYHNLLHPSDSRLPLEEITEDDDNEKENEDDTEDEEQDEKLREMEIKVLDTSCEGVVDVEDSTDNNLITDSNFEGVETAKDMKRSHAEVQGQELLEGKKSRQAEQDKFLNRRNARAPYFEGGIHNYRGFMDIGSDALFLKYEGGNADWVKRTSDAVNRKEGIKGK